MFRVAVTNAIFDETRNLLSKRCVLVDRSDVSADGMLAFMTDRVDEAFLATFPNLKIIACALKGYDNFDVEACTRRGVHLTIVPDLLTDPTAELTIGLMIAVSRQVMVGDQHIRSGSFQGWEPRFYGQGLDGSTVGIVGFGAVGQSISKRLSGFDTRILITDDPVPEETPPGIEVASLDRILGESDFLVLAVPLSDQTSHLINRDRISMMKQGAFLINPARGSVVDESAVADALESGHLAGYAADVFEMEDWAKPSRPKEIEPRLLAMPEKTVLTPHIGSAVTTVRKLIEQEAALNILDYLDGAMPRGAVNPTLSQG